MSHHGLPNSWNSLVGDLPCGREVLQLSRWPSYVMCGAPVLENEPVEAALRARCSIYTYGFRMALQEGAHPPVRNGTGSAQRAYLRKRCISLDAQLLPLSSIRHSMPVDGGSLRGFRLPFWQEITPPFFGLQHGQFALTASLPERQSPAPRWGRAMLRGRMLCDDLLQEHVKEHEVDSLSGELQCRSGAVAQSLHGEGHNPCSAPAFRLLAPRDPPHLRFCRI